MFYMQLLIRLFISFELVWKIGSSQLAALVPTAKIELGAIMRDSCHERMLGRILITSAPVLDKQGREFPTAAEIHDHWRCGL